MDKLLILFDIDWTLLAGGLPEHIDGFSYAWKSVLGIDAKLSDWPDHHGQPDVVLLAKVPELCHEIKKEVINEKIGDLKQAKIEYFFAHAQKDYHKYILPGVVDLLFTLSQKNIPLAIKSGNLEKIGMYRLKSCELESYFTTGGWGDNVSSKAESIEIAIGNAEKILGRKFFKENIYDVGDSKYDMDADKKANIHPIGVCSGYDKRDVLEKAGAEFILDSLKEKEVFLKIIQK